MVHKLAFAALLVSPALAAANPLSTDANYPASARSEAQILQPRFLPEPANPVQRAARAFGNCVRDEARALPADLAAEAAAASLMQRCAVPFQAIAQAADAAIAEARWSEGRKQVARAQLRARLDLVPQRVAASLRDRSAMSNLLAR